MERVEQLLSALAERDRLLQDARIRARRDATLAQAMDLIYGAEDPDQGIAAALSLCCTAAGAESWFLLGPGTGGTPALLAGSDAALQDVSWPEHGPVLARALRVGDLAETDWAVGMPDQMRAYRSLVSTPVPVPFQPPLAIGLLARERGSFSRDDLELLRRIGGLLRQSLANRLLARRNAALRMVVDASAAGDTPKESRYLDRSFEALQRSFGHVADWQGRIVAITNELLSARVSDSQGAIDHALARIGALSASDRTYVFRLRDGSRMDNTNEWVATGIAPMIGQLQDLPTDLLVPWRDDLMAGHAVQIADVDALPENDPTRAVLAMQGIRSLLIAPMLRNGVLAGFVGFDAVGSPRQFLPLEVQLLQSVCTAIGAVIDRAEAEHCAELARQSLHATLLSVPFLVLELDHEGRFTGVFEGAGQRVGWPHDVLLGRMPEDFLRPELAALARRVMALVDRDGRTEGHEYQLAIDGELRTFVLSAAPKMIKGSKVGYVFATRDITRRVQERRQLLRLGKIAELTSNLVVVTDALQRIEWVNPAFERRTGWTLDEVRGKRPDSFLTTERTSAVEMHRIGNQLRAGQAVRGELLNRTRSGEEFWISKDIQPLFDANGAIEGFVAVQTDITELKQSHLRALRDRAMAMDASSDGIAITDATGYYLYMNPAHRAMFGIGLMEDVGRLHWQDLYTPEAVRRFLADHWPTLEDYGVWRGELFGKHRDGRTVAQEVSLTRREQGLLCITRDISRRLEMEAERTRLRESLQLAQSRETVAHLAGGLAHDLNNLVAVVSGSANLLRELCHDQPEAQAGLDRILRAAQTATDLVAGLARLGRQHRERGSHDLRKIVSEAVDLLGSIRIRAHSIRTDMPDTVCPVWANVTELLQVVVNLALNACQAGEGSDNVVTLSVGRDTDGLPTGEPDAGIVKPGLPYALFRVRDTGAGIDPAIRSRLFERYFTTKGQGGTGLGLPIVAGILRDNDAALWIDSRPGQGTTITVAWPQGATDRSAAAPSSVRPPASLAGHRILVVDDLPDVADVISDMLETADAICIAVSDPGEALQLLTENPGLWSALVTDQDMPNLRGTDLARTAQACQPPIATVLVTALQDSVGPDRALFHTVLAKPVTAETLIAAVGHAIADQRPAPQSDRATARMAGK